jgi:hypothetical protein
MLADSELSDAGTFLLNTHKNVQLGKQPIPFYLKGELPVIRAGLLPEELELAIAINGTIWGTTKPTIEEQKVTFTVRVPTEAWEAGQNVVSIYSVVLDGKGNRKSLVPFSVADQRADGGS